MKGIYPNHLLVLGNMLVVVSLPDSPSNGAWWLAGCTMPHPALQPDNPNFCLSYKGKLTRVRGQSSSVKHTQLQKYLTHTVHAVASVFIEITCETTHHSHHIPITIGVYSTQDRVRILMVSLYTLWIKPAVCQAI